jgi:hypothetical protein
MIVLDVEIKKAICGRGEEKLPGIEYCGGWGDRKGMGVAVVCTYDLETDLSRVFFEQDLVELEDYLTGKVTAGFNTWKFDLPLLGEHGMVNFVQWGYLEQHFDALREIWIALGVDPDNWTPHGHGSWKLDNIMEATFGLKKSGDGAMAPIWWQQGNVRRVVDYCLRDVWLEAKLVTHLLEGRPVSNEVGKKPWLVVPQRKAA